jgi:hypoxanthine phosphoribosyltransferase
MRVADGSILLTRQQIEDRIAGLGLQISSDYQGRSLAVIGILKGSFIFVADLIRQIHPAIPVEVDFIGVSSYGESTSSSGNIQITKDIDIPVEGKDVIIVEDIVDTGLTLTHVHRIVAERGARSIRVAALLEKPESREYEGVVDYVGFQIPSRFVVGYGLDHAQRYRNLSEIRVLDEI